MVKNWKISIINSLLIHSTITKFVPWDHFCNDVTLFVKWRHNFHKFCKKRNVHRCWTTCAIKSIDPSLGRYLIADFKNRQFADLGAYNFVDVTFLEYKVSTMWPRWWCHGTLGSYKSKDFLSKYFWISFIKFPSKQKSSFKENISFIQRTPLPNPCRFKIKNGTQSKRCEIDRLLTKGFIQISK